MDVEYNMDDVRHMLNAFGNAITDIQMHGDAMRNLYAALGANGMEGEAYNSFFARFGDWHNFLSHFTAHLDEVHSVMSANTASAEPVRVACENLM